APHSRRCPTRRTSDLPPPRHSTSTWRSRGISAARCASSCSGMCTACGARPAAHSSCSRTSSRYPSSGTVLTSTTGTLSPNTGASPHPTFRCAGEPPCGAPRPKVMRTQIRATALARSSALAALLFTAAACGGGSTEVAAPADDPSTVPSESPSPETELSIEIDYQEDPGQGE